MTERLDQAVTDGKITAEQKDLIIAKGKEMKQKMEEIRNLSSDTERKTAMEQLRTDTEKWLSDNKIDQRFLGPLGGMRGPGRGHGGPMGEMPAQPTK